MHSPRFALSTGGHSYEYLRHPNMHATPNKPLGKVGGGHENLGRDKFQKLTEIFGLRFHDFAPRSQIHTRSRR